MKRTDSNRGLRAWAMSMGAGWALAVVEPVLDLIGRYPQFLVAHQMGMAALVVFLLLLCLIGPAALVALLWLAHRRSELLGLWVARCLLGCLATLLLLLALRPVVQGPFVLVLMAATAGGALIVLTDARLRPFRLLVRYLSATLLISPALFFWSKGVRDISSQKEPLPIHRVQTDSRNPVVVVVFDELPLATLLSSSGRIHAEHFPNFAALSQTATWFRDATTVSDSTQFALPALLTGTYPDVQRRPLPLATTYPENLFTLLAGSHRIQAREYATQFCSASLCDSSRRPTLQQLVSVLSDVGVIYLHLLLPARLAGKFGRVDLTWNGFSSPGRDPVETFRNFVASIGGDRSPALYFIHSEIPHQPWIYLPSGRRYLERRDGIAPVDGRWPRDDDLVEVAFQRHFLQVRLADQLLGSLMERLKASRLFDESLLVVTSDHGVHFEPGGEMRAISVSNYAGVARVPLLVKLPGQTQGGLSDRAAQTIDVVPTLADALGIDLPWQSDGVSLLDDAPGETGKKIFRAAGPAAIQSPDKSAFVETVACVEGRTLPVVQGAMRAYLDRVAAHPERLSMSGWSADLNQPGPVSMALFADDRLVTLGTTGENRSDLALALEDSRLSRAGYFLQVDAHRLEGASQVRLFAIHGDVAQEVEYPADYPWGVDTGSAPPLPDGSDTSCPASSDGEGSLLQFLVDPPPASPFQERLQALVDGAGPDGLFRRPPCDSLLGKALGDLSLSLEADVEVRLRSPERYRDVDPDGSSLPAAVRGILAAESESAIPEQILIALNGVIRGQGLPYQTRGDEAQFQIMLPEDAFLQGPNAVTVLAAKCSAEATLLGRIPPVP